ncbi:MAG: acyl-CoA synthetase, partial [Acidobacteriota bacterium]
ADPEIRRRVVDGLRRHNGEAGGSSRRIARVLLMAEPASIDAGEITDKGYVNQSATLERRAPLVEELFSDPPPASVWVV